MPMGLAKLLRAQAAIVIEIDASELLGYTLLAHLLPFGQAELAIVVAV
ncbi:MAG: hypothetical protein ABIW30_03490 [Arenimonas sp.]